MSTSPAWLLLVRRVHDSEQMVFRVAAAVLEKVAVCLAILKVSSTQFFPSPARAGGRPTASLTAVSSKVLCSGVNPAAAAF
eukprot:2357253-Amphidinium_carterae.4